MNILLIGKTGQLGGSILKVPNAHQIYAPDRADMDIESGQSCEKVITDFQLDVVINTAAFHNVPQCEDDPLRTFAVNCIAVRNLAAICKKKDIRLISFSTDYVFGGDKRTPYSEDDRTAPLQMYGISRLAGELAAIATAPKHTVVIRTCGLYGLSGASSKGGNFVDKRIAEAQSGSFLEMGCDQIVSPTFTDDLAQAIFKLIEHPELQPGIYHLVNEGQCTWFEFTKAIFDLMEIEIKVQPVDRRGKTGEMRRPLYSALANTKAGTLGISMPHWRDALHRYLIAKYGIEKKIRNNNTSP